MAGRQCFEVSSLIPLYDLQAYAAARMAESILRGLDGEEGVFEAAYVESNVVPGLSYFASKVRLGTSGAEEVYGLRNLSPVEKKGIEELTPILKGNIEKGIEFAKAPPTPPPAPTTPTK